MLPQQAITVAGYNCWILVDIDGKPYDPRDGGVPHHAGKQEAEGAYTAMFRRYNDDDELAEVPLLLPAELGIPCSTVTAACGYVLDDEGDGICHNPDPQELVAWALGLGWSVIDDGRMVCADPTMCEECGALVAASPAPPGPTPGQLSIDGGELVTPGCELPALGPLSAEVLADLSLLGRPPRRPC